MTPLRNPLSSPLTSFQSTSSAIRSSVAFPRCPTRLSAKLSWPTRRSDIVPLLSESYRQENHQPLLLQSPRESGRSSAAEQGGGALHSLHSWVREYWIVRFRAKACTHF